MTERERILKAKGYRFDCSAPTHDSAVLKAKWFRRHGYFATVVTETSRVRGIYYYSVWTREKKGVDKEQNV